MIEQLCMHMWKHVTTLIILFSMFSSTTMLSQWYLNLTSNGTYGRYHMQLQTWIQMGYINLIRLLILGTMRTDRKPKVTFFRKIQKLL